MRETDRNDLRPFSFSGVRLTILCLQVQERLQANNVRDHKE